jgi:glycosyltransferase involved in cell wall biosynthesis
LPAPSSGPKASILINNYNYGRYLRQCIDSARAQTYDNIEIIVVDDGSTDHSGEIIRSYGDEIVPVFKQNGGQASCFNTGFESSRGDVIFFLDSDDVFHREKIAAVMNIYCSPDVQWCVDMTDTSKVPEMSGPIPDAAVELRDWRASIANGAIPYVPAPTSGLSFRRSLLSRILPMPTASGITLSDNYLKFAGSALGVAAVCTVPLTYQRIHDANRYTRSPQIRARQGEIMKETGEQLVLRFPFLAAMAVKLVSRGIAEQVARSPERLPLLVGHWRASPFTFVQKIQITVLSAMKAGGIRLGRR